MTDQPLSPPAEEEGAAPEPASPSPKRGRAAKVIVGVVAVLALVLLTVVVVVVVGNVLAASDPTQDAKVGDCLANLPEAVPGEETSVTAVKVVTCDSPDAKYTVAGRIEGVTADRASTSEVCGAFPEATMRFHAIPAGGGEGYVLCLKPA